jgi:hypothetical protein
MYNSSNKNKTDLKIKHLAFFLNPELYADKKRNKK